MIADTRAAVLRRRLDQLLLRRPHRPLADARGIENYCSASRRTHADIGAKSMPHTTVQGELPELPKPCAAAIENLTWASSSQEHKPVYGFSLILLVWTNERCRRALP
jgi:hypothetical protein